MTLRLTDSGDGRGARIVAVGFHPSLVARDEPTGLGTVDYRLQRRRTLRDVRDGTVARDAVCDAHPELTRVARSTAPDTRETCPICEDRWLARVSYVFGPRLPAGGKLAMTQSELDRIATRSGTFASYEVEICGACGWNHLLRRTVLAGD